MKIAIIANPEKYSVKAPFIGILNWSDAHDGQTFFSKKLQELYQGSTHVSATVTDTEEQAIAQANIVITIGGDGTMLYATRLMKNDTKPVLGVNSGRLGFMANTQHGQLAKALNCVAKEDYSLQTRYLLQAKAEEGGEYFALNEFLFAKKDSTSMVTISASYDGMFVNKYWADGLIVASPTGSTAYNLSSGGPIVAPNSNVMALTPVNPHTLTTRPVILPSNKPLEITVPQQQHEVLFSFDGTSREINNYPLKIKIKRSDYTLNLIELPDKSYFDTLRHKLMWGKDFRKR